VYNRGSFFNDHPGGAESTILVARENGTEDLMTIHSSDAGKQLADFHICTQSSQKVEDKETSGFFLHPKKRKTVRLSMIKPVLKDAKIFRF